MEGEEPPQVPFDEILDELTDQMGKVSTSDSLKQTSNETSSKIEAMMNSDDVGD